VILKRRRRVRKIRRLRGKRRAENPRGRSWSKGALLRGMICCKTTTKTKRSEKRSKKRSSR
jgi:hypothetical protein